MLALVLINKSQPFKLIGFTAISLLVYVAIKTLLYSACVSD